MTSRINEGIVRDRNVYSLDDNPFVKKNLLEKFQVERSHSEPFGRKKKKAPLDRISEFFREVISFSSPNSPSSFQRPYGYYHMFKSCWRFIDMRHIRMIDDCLKREFPDLIAEDKIGQGVSGSVWLVHMKGGQYVIKWIASNMHPKEPVDCKLSDLSESFIGAEWLQFLNFNSSHIIHSHYAIFWDHSRKAFRTMDRNQVEEIITNPALLNGNCFSLYGIISEYIENVETLGEYIQRKNHFSSEDLIFFGYQMLLGVNDLNAERVLQRDIKPEDILVQGERGLILIDFGCARLIPEKMGNVIKRGGSYLGTIPYMAPEIRYFHDGSLCYDHLSDVYSIFAILYYMGSGQHVDEVDSIEPFLSTCDEKFADLLRKMGRSEPFNGFLLKLLLDIQFLRKFRTYYQ